MSWKDFLEDYDCREDESIKEFYLDLLNGRLPSKATYPPRERFPGMKDPIAQSRLCNVWGSIPFEGRVVVPLRPGVTAQDFDRAHQHLGITFGSLDKTLAYARRWRRLGFFLDAKAETFVNQDFLQPLFDEFRPPRRANFPLDFLVEEQTLMSEAARFDALDQGVHKVLTQAMFEMGVRNPFVIASGLEDYFVSYVFLKHCGYPELAQVIDSLWASDPETAITYLGALRPLLVSPALDLAAFSPVLLRFTLRAGAEALAKSKLSPKKLGLPSIPPYEVGRFLLSQKLPAPETLEDCEAVTEAYTARGLHALREALARSIEKNDGPAVLESSRAMEAACRDVWDDLNRYSWVEPAAGRGVVVGLGVIGEIASHLLGAGVLGDLALAPAHMAAGVFLEPRAGAATRKLAALLLGRNHLFALYDFKQAPMRR